MLKKKLIILLLAFLLLGTVALFANAEGEEGAGGNQVSILYRDNSSYPVQSDWAIWDWIEEATGVRMNYISAPDSSYDAKMQIVIASGEPPEIICTTGPASPEYAANGILLPISDYWHLLPNMKNFIDSNDYEREMYNLTAEDGKIYSLPVKADTVRSSTKGWMIRTDIFDKHNIPYPETLDDVYEAGKLLKEIYPDSSPIINRFTSNNILSTLAFGYGTRSGWSVSTNGHFYDEKNDNYKFAPSSDRYKEFLTYVKKLYDEGILNEEFNSMASSTYEQLVVQGETFILMDWVGNQVRYNVTGSVSNPDFNIWPIIPPKGPYGDYAIGLGQMYEQWWMLPSHLVDLPNFEQIMGFIDWFYSEEASILTTFGKEGITYKVNSDGTLNFIDPNIDYTREYGLLNNSLNVRRHPDWFVAMNGPEIGQLYDDIRALNIFREPEIGVKYNEDEIDELKLLVPGMDGYFRSMTLKFLYGDFSLEDDWDEYVAECDDKGASDIGELINAAYLRQKARQ